MQHPARQAGGARVRTRWRALALQSATSRPQGVSFHGGQFSVIWDGSSLSPQVETRWQPEGNLWISFRAGRLYPLTAKLDGARGWKVVFSCEGIVFRPSRARLDLRGRREVCLLSAEIPVLVRRAAGAPPQNHCADKSQDEYDAQRLDGFDITCCVARGSEPSGSDRDQEKDRGVVQHASVREG